MAADEEEPESELLDELAAGAGVLEPAEAEELPEDEDDDEDEPALPPLDA